MRVLIIKTSALGDIIHTFPVIQFLKKQNPEVMIDWVVEQPFSELVASHPDIHHVFSIHTKKWRKEWFKKSTRDEIKNFIRSIKKQKYDVVFDLQGNIKSGLVTAFAKSPVKVGFGLQTVPEWPNVICTDQRMNPPKGKNIREDYLYLVRTFFKDNQAINENVIKLKIKEGDQEKLDAILKHPQLTSRKKWMVCPGSNWPNKQISKETLKTFLTLLSQTDDGSFLFIWGTKEEKQLAEDLGNAFLNCSVVVEKLSLPALQNLMSHMNFVISMDSLPLHLAETAGVPTYSVFGASSAHKYMPLGDNHYSFQGSCPYGKTFEKRCPILRTCATGSCIKDITGEKLFRHFLSQI